MAFSRTPSTRLVWGIWRDSDGYAVMFCPSEEAAENKLRSTWGEGYTIRKCNATRKTAENKRQFAKMLKEYPPKKGGKLSVSRWKAPEVLATAHVL